MPGDPLIDEEGILELLSVPVQANTIGALQAGAVQALLDLYDRKVTREEFIKSAAPCIELHAQAAKLWLLNNITRVYADGELDEERLKRAHDGLTAITTTAASRVHDIVSKLVECPTSEDKIH